MTLTIRDLAVSFGGVAALAGVSFDVHPGTITSVIGPNGAGKTTAFNAITGYLRPTRGRIEYVGVPLTGLRPSAIAVARSRASCRTASSGWSSWRWRSRPGRACCCSTSPARA